MSICGIMPPRRHEMLSFELKDHPCECILPTCHHPEEHVFMKPNGVYIIWGDDFTCGCCTPEESDRCTFFGEISFEEVQKLLEAPA